MRALSKPLTTVEEAKIFREKVYQIGVDKDGMVTVAMRGYGGGMRAVRERSPGRALDKLLGK